MKKSLVMLMSFAVVTVSALAQAPSPAPAPEGAPPARAPREGGDRPERIERPRGAMMGEQMSMERLVGAIAQGPEMAKKLSLTPEQQEQIKKISLEQRTKMIDQYAALQKAALKQAEVLMAEPLDEKVLMDAVEETSKVRAEIAKQQIQLLIEMRKVMTEEQRKGLRELMMQMKQSPAGRAGGPGETREPGRMREGMRERGGAEGGRGEAPAPAPREQPAERAPAPAPAPAERAPAPAPAPAPVERAPAPAE